MWRTDANAAAVEMFPGGRQATVRRSAGQLERGVTYQPDWYGFGQAALLSEGRIGPMSAPLLHDVRERVDDEFG